MVGNRIVYFDLVRLFAVLLVVIGHVVSQYDLRGYNAPINIWIYSFHMPLFMFLSGFFFNHSLKKKFKELICQKGILLLLPLCSWSIVSLILKDLVPSSFDSWGQIIWKYVTAGGLIRGLWYLKCLFIYVIICYLAVKILKNEFLAAIVTISGFLCLPNINFSGQMIVFFWCGFFYNKLRIQKSIDVYKLLVLSGSVMLIIMLNAWRPEYSYLNGNKTFYEYIIFILVGISSAIFWIHLFQVLFQKSTQWINALAQIGSCSLGIYCSQEYFYLHHFWGWLLDRFQNNTVVYIGYSLIITMICYLLVRLLQKYKYTSLFLLGMRKRL